MLVHARDINLSDATGRTYGRAYVYAETQPGGTWQGWIEFTSDDGDRAVQTERETTQSTLEGVAYWATGLETTFLKGALDRAVHRGRSEPVRTSPPPSPILAREVDFRLITIDPDVPFRLMGTRTLVPGMRRYIHNGGVIVYRGPLRDAGGSAPGLYEFSAQFGSDTAAALMANRMWSDLLGLGARLEIGGIEVPLDHIAIKEAMLGALVS
jgi:hypothetical protein